MSWAVGYDNTWQRDVGYGVPARCDQPLCQAQIDRGLAYVCGSDPFGGESGCGLYFCSDHLFWNAEAVQLCDRCIVDKQPYAPTEDVEQWTKHKMTDPSWADWRAEQGS